MGHSHGAAGSAGAHGPHGAMGATRAQDRSRLRWVLLLTATVLVAELAGAWWSGSLALLADAGHMAVDVGAVTLALAASYVAGRPADDRRTFGSHRAEVLAALGNSVALLLLCGYLLVEGARRLADPPSVQAGPMLAFAVAGLVVNGIGVALLVGRQESLNMRGAYLEVLGDLLGSVVVVAAALVVATTGGRWADPAATLLIAVLILPRALSLARDAVEVLLESAPAHVDLGELRGHLLGMPGVVDVHDLHAWTITSGLPSLSVHVTVADEVLAERGVGALLDELSGCVAAHFAVEHTTFQIEPRSHRDHENLGGLHD